MAQATHLERRFGGIAKLYGTHGLERFTNSHVCVIGVGGVGSWAVESLARSGIGEITMIDLDVVAESNINRQLPAMSSTLGNDKTAVLAERITDINPDCRIHIIDDFISIENVAELLTRSMDFVMDCIDSSRVKAALISHCKRHKIKVITVGGAGGQIDPAKITLGDLSQTQQDPLLSKTRKLLRQEYGLSRDPKKRFSVPAVYSLEAQRYALKDGSFSFDKPAESGSSLSCAGGLGSCTTVTASFALRAVAEVLKKLAATPSHQD
ncbi:MAG: tRNA cyclic N6-threonylcarbamoyladenosine(37) synthase TcdA [Proteobacteria bacterium]|nr:MAG: tRNA cyclic N6-threonylcarbamoyladenosine(37) synthase TcdA [Pseudomonadota bacterium]